jgi:hypothetical protein
MKRPDIACTDSRKDSSHHLRRMPPRSRLLAGVFLISALAPCGVEAQVPPSSLADRVTLSANLDGGFRTTQFVEPAHAVSLIQWDSRIELWLPPSRRRFAWGPYVRVAGVKSSGQEAWANAWLGLPGIGAQVYPFSPGRFRRSGSLVGQLLGPTRLFVERNVLDYLGKENSWRPSRQTRAGLDYWKALGVNDSTRTWWLESWHAAYWQSSNEFSDRYNAAVLANAFRGGLRKVGGRASALTPYVAVESSRTSHRELYWENRLLIGGGLRVAPFLRPPPTERPVWVSRLVLYAEVLNAAAYYGASAPSSVPRNDIRLGINVSSGVWYK